MVRRGTRIRNPSYDSRPLRCSNSYCHGNFEVRQATAPPQYQYAFADTAMFAASASPLWTGALLKLTAELVTGSRLQAYWAVAVDHVRVERLPSRSCGCYRQNRRQVQAREWYDQCGGSGIFVPMIRLILPENRGTNTNKEDEQYHANL